MIRKKNKTAPWALALSLVTFLTLVSFLLLSYTNVGSYFSFLNMRTDLEKSYEKIDKLIVEKDFLMKQLKVELEESKELKYENNLLLIELEFKNKKIDSLEKNVRNLEYLRAQLSLAIQKQKGIIKSKGSSPVIEKEVKETTKNNDIIADKSRKKDSLNERKGTKKIPLEESSPIQDIVKDEYDEIRLLNLDIKTTYSKGADFVKETTNADKVNTIEIEYTLYKDRDSNKSTNQFFIQIFDTNNQSLANTYTTMLNGKELIYSFVSDVACEKLVNKVKGKYSVGGLNLHEGIYFFNIFSKDGRLLSSRSFKLN
ncbi:MULTISPECIES: hypothetical protein [Flavobacterium]|uniref:Uncharacterized protein n=1 Tax=Flavobacterium jumunjinense TaxID=998845 RepID=A0ABV5GQT9_9FLAO|nr:MULTISPECIES: hypothetical protein [Flavobacterium]